VVKKYLLSRLILDRIYQSQGLRELVADLVDSFDQISVVNHPSFLARKWSTSCRRGWSGCWVVGAAISVVGAVADEEVVDAD
jgi:hypothetical protein